MSAELSSTDFLSSDMAGILVQFGRAPKAPKMDV